MTRSKSNVGILGIGTYLPPDVRKNDWWPDNVVRKWTDKRASAKARFKPQPPSTEGMGLVMAAMAKLEDDPFQGAVERRIAPRGMLASDMELKAARDAIASSHVDPSEIDLLLCYSSVPDHLITNNACLLHKHLELGSNCFSLSTDAACNSFLMQLALAEQMIAGGRARKALLVQSCSVSTLVEQDESASPWFGDGATAVVVGPVDEGRGVIESAQRTDGRYHQMLVASVPDRRWYDDGKVCLYSADPSAARQTFLDIADTGKEVVDDALAKAGVTAADINFFGVHQGTPWLRKVTLEHFGLKNAKSVETFAWAASLFACNIPLGLSIGAREGMLKKNDLVLMYAGGAGLTYSAVVLRW